MNRSAPIDAEGSGPVSPAADRSAREWLEAGCPPGAPTRRASTVMVLRDGASGGEPGGGVEVFMQRRVATMAFAASMWVFPGGGVDPRDADSDTPWAGPSPQAWAVQMGVSRPEALELICAAVREVFEECGVLLAGPAEHELLADVTGPTWRGYRAGLIAKDISLSQILVTEGLVLRSDLLSLQDHWVTPEFEPKRYDTYFFAALMPQGQTADDLTTEADLSCWVHPADLLADLAADRASMLTPTIANVERLNRADTPVQVVESIPEIRSIMPVAEYDEDGEVVFRWES